MSRADRPGAQLVCRQDRVGRPGSGSLSAGQDIVHIKAAGETAPATVGQVFVFHSLKREPVQGQLAISSPSPACGSASATL